MKRRSLFVLILIGALLVSAFLAGCGQGTEESASGETGEATTSGEEGSTGDALAAFEGLTGEVTMAGGTAHIPALEEAVARIQAKYPDLEFTIEGGHSAVGVEKVGEGVVDIGNTGRALTDEEKAKYPDLVSFEMAKDGVAIIVHPSNPVNDITTQQLKDVYAGRITNWSELGGTDAPIVLYNFDEASGTREVLFKKALGEAEDAFAANPTIVSELAVMVETVAGDENALGYCGIAQVDETVKALTYDGVEPSKENAKSGTYPLVRSLFMNTKGQPEGLVKAFIDYVLSPDMYDAIEEAGYIPLD